VWIASLVVRAFRLRFQDHCWPLYFQGRSFSTSQEIDSEERLRYDLFDAEWDVKT